MYEFYSNEHGSFSVEVVYGKMFLHANISLWNKEMLNTCAVVWEDFKKQAKEQGYTVVYSIIPKDRKIIKFNMMFGGKMVEEIRDCILMEFKLET